MMKCFFAVSLILFLVLPPAASLAGLRADIHPRLGRWCEQSGPEEKAAVWVFLADKGPLKRAEVEARLRELAGRLPAASLERRLRARGTRPFDTRDLPLYRPYVMKLADTGVEIRAFSKWLNAVSVTATVDQIEEMARLPFVESLRLVSGRRGGPEPVAACSAPPAAPASGEYGESWRQLEQIQVLPLHAEGYTGAGIKVAVFDTGFWLEHEAFDDINVIAEWDFINDDSVTANQAGDRDDQHCHGTMCLSVIGGHSVGSLIGPAYGAQYILAKTEDMAQEQPVEEDWWIEAAEWADSLGAQVISSSLCYNDWYTYEDMDGNTAPITIAADMAAANGIVVVNAAGNSGSSEWKYILAPADGDSVVTLGSVDSTGVRSYWSSQGPTYDGRIKPTVMAMGEATFIADPVGGTSAYRRGSGTSFATPLAAGAIALILEKNPLWTSAQVLDAVMNTASMAGSPDTLYGYGILAAHAASEYPAAGVASHQRPGRLLTVYPNPAVSEFVILHKGISGYARIFDAAGRFVASAGLSPEGITSIDLDRLTGGSARGFYFIKAGSAGTGKVLVLK
jgi:serine protease AprX